jgi:radical SAM superfamily enzyme YgiQ (UPF0313 family)
MEIRYLEGVRVFDFEDDNLTLQRDQIMELCGRISEKFQGREITLLAMNGISYKNLDAEILTQMKKAGFSRLNLALVSSAPKVLKNLGRPHQAESLAEVVQTAVSLDFELEVHQIIGLPNETLASMAEGMIFLSRLPVLIGVSTFYLTPRTEIAALFPPMAERDIFRSRSTAMAYPSKECDRDDLFTLFTTARIINFLKGLRMEGSQMHLEEFLQEQSGDERTLLGSKVLKKLLSEKKLYTWNKGKFSEHGRFKYRTFERVWQQLDLISTQTSQKILLP